MDVGFRGLSGEDDWSWVNARLPLDLSSSTTGLVAYNKADDERLAIMVCESWTSNSVQCHIIIQHRAAIRRGFLNECARYVFTLTDRKMMIGIVPSNKTAALKLNKRLGFTHVGTIPNAFEDGNDAVILQLLRENCPYWEGYIAAPREVCNG